MANGVTRPENAVGPSLASGAPLEGALCSGPPIRPILSHPRPGPTILATGLRRLDSTRRSSRFLRVSPC